jgi:TonB family protein
MRITALRILFSIGLVVLLAPAPRAQHDNPIKDTDVKVTAFADLTYPPLAAQSRMQGVVVVEVKLDDQGKVVEAEALSGWPLLATSSTENVKKWRFEPNPRKAAVIVYQFRIEGVCHGADASSHMIFHPPNFASITDCSRPPTDIVP